MIENDGINTEADLDLRRANMVTPPTRSSDRVELYRSGLRKKWRWRYVAANGNILADSGQGYSRRVDALNGAAVVTGTKMSRDSGLMSVAREIVVREMS